MKKFLLKIKSLLLSQREIICVSRNGITSKKIGSLFLFWNLALVLWTAFATVKYFDLREEVATKEFEISKLKTNKQRLLSNVVLLDKNISNIKKFIFSLNKYDRFASLDEKKVYNLKTEKYDDNIKLVLNRVKNDIKNINIALSDRIVGLEKIKQKLKLNKNIELVSYDKKISIDNNNIDKDVFDSIVMKKRLDKNIEYLQNLEVFINDMPFKEPIQANYISSRFGVRLDPFLKTRRFHHGVDFVGSYMAKIIAPADGKVIFAGRKRGYGKVIVIQHEHDMKTIYGHLSKYNVKVGEIVKRGQVIAKQGNTGRSTGQHLHYEIMQGNHRYNPMNFVEIGNTIY